jgi:hypothetical protein
VLLLLVGIPTMGGQANTAVASPKVVSVEKLEDETIYTLSVISATAGFFFDMFLDFWVIAQFYKRGQILYFTLSACIIFVSSTIIGVACFNSPRAEHRHENAWLTGFLAFIRVQLLIEMADSLTPHCFERGFGTPLYYKIKFFIGVTASAPQAVLQTFILLTSVNTETEEGTATKIMLQLSILSALLCLSFVAYEKDRWFLQTHDDILSKTHSSWTNYMVLTILFRTCEVCSRSISLALLAMLIPVVPYILFFCLEVCLIVLLLHTTQGRHMKRSRKESAQAVSTNKPVSFMIGVYALCAVVRAFFYPEASLAHSLAHSPVSSLSPLLSYCFSRISTPSLTFNIHTHSPFTMHWQVIWPMALLQSRRGMSRATEWYYALRFVETVIVIVLVLVNFFLSWRDHALLSEHMGVFLVWVVSTAMMPLLYVSLASMSRSLFSSEKKDGGGSHQDLSSPRALFMPHYFRMLRDAGSVNNEMILELEEGIAQIDERIIKEAKRVGNIITHIQSPKPKEGNRALDTQNSKPKVDNRVLDTQSPKSKVDNRVLEDAAAPIEESVVKRKAVKKHIV